MRSTSVLPAFALLALVCAARGGEKMDVAEIERIQRILVGHRIRAKALVKEMPLPKFLATLEGLLPKGSELSIRVDAEAFGKDLAAVNAAKVSAFATPGETALETILGRACGQVSKSVPVVYAIRDRAIVITRPRLAAHSATYPVRDLVGLMPRLVKRMPRAKPGGTDEDSNLYDDIGAKDGPGLLVRMLTNAVDLESWEAIGVRNGVRLTVLASPHRQNYIADLLTALRRMNDVAAIMNARLYEMDRAAYAKHVAPLFAKDEETGEAPAVVQIDAPLLRILTRQKLIGESEDEKLVLDEEAVFLAQQRVFRFDAGVVPAGKKKGTGLAGVTFRVRPQVSADRRFLTLRITQHVRQLVGIAKTTKLDASTGKEIAVESPNVRATTVRGRVRIPDSDAIVMPVDYRPPGKDKVWVLVARPFIRIEQEERERLQQGLDEVTAESIWEYEIPKEERSAPGK